MAPSSLAHDCFPARREARPFDGRGTAIPRWSDFGGTSVRTVPEGQARHGGPLRSTLESCVRLQVVKWALLGWAWVYAGVVWGQVPGEVAEWLRQRQQALGRIASLQAEVDVVEFQGDQEELSWTVRWWKDGPREKFTTRWYVTSAMVQSEEKPEKRGRISVPRFPQAKDPSQVPQIPPDLMKLGTEHRVQEVARHGAVVRQLDIRFGTSGSRALHVPLHPAGPHGFDFSRTEGSLRPWAAGRLLSPTPALLLDFALGDYRSLDKVIAAARQVRWRREEDGRVTILCALAVPDAAEFEALEFTLDPARGYLLWRVSAPQGGRREVVEVAEPQPGVYFPTRVRLGTPQQTNLELRVRKLRVNEPVSPEVFEVVFPEGAKVNDSTGPRQVIHLWGRDGRPARTFETPQAFDAWHQEELARYYRSLSGEEPPRGLAGRPIALIVGNLLLVVVLVGLIILRRRRVRRVAPAAAERSTAAK